METQATLQDYLYTDRTDPENWVKSFVIYQIEDHASKMNPFYSLMSLLANNIEAGEVTKYQKAFYMRMYGIFNQNFSEANTIEELIIVSSLNHVDALLQMADATYIILNQGTYRVPSSKIRARELAKILYIYFNKLASYLKYDTLQKKVRDIIHDLPVNSNALKKLLEDPELSTNDFIQENEVALQEGIQPIHSEKVQEIIARVCGLDYGKSPTYNFQLENSAKGEANELVKNLLTLYYYAEVSANKFQSISQYLGNCYMNVFVQPIIIQLTNVLGRTVNNFLRDYYFCYQVLINAIYIYPRFWLYEVMNINDLLQHAGSKRSFSTHYTKAYEPQVHNLESITKLQIFNYLQQIQKMFGLDKHEVNEKSAGKVSESIEQYYKEEKRQYRKRGGEEDEKINSAVENLRKKFVEYSDKFVEDFSSMSIVNGFIDLIESKAIYQGNLLVEDFGMRKEFLESASPSAVDYPNPCQAAHEYAPNFGLVQTRGIDYDIDSRPVLEVDNFNFCMLSVSRELRIRAESGKKKIAIRFKQDLSELQNFVLIRFDELQNQKEFIKMAPTQQQSIFSTLISTLNYVQMDIFDFSLMAEQDKTITESLEHKINQKNFRVDNNTDTDLQEFLQTSGTNIADWKNLVEGVFGTKNQEELKLAIYFLLDRLDYMSDTLVSRHQRSGIYAIMEVAHKKIKQQNKKDRCLFLYQGNESNEGVTLRYIQNKDDDSIKDNWSKYILNEKTLQAYFGEDLQKQVTGQMIDGIKEFTVDLQGGDVTRMMFFYLLRLFLICASYTYMFYGFSNGPMVLDNTYWENVVSFLGTSLYLDENCSNISPLLEKGELKFVDYQNRFAPPSMYCFPIYTQKVNGEYVIFRQNKFQPLLLDELKKYEESKIFEIEQRNDIILSNQSVQRHAEKTTKKNHVIVIDEKRKFEYNLGDKEKILENLRKAVMVQLHDQFDLALINLQRFDIYYQPQYRSDYDDFKKTRDKLITILKECKSLYTQSKILLYLTTFYQLTEEMLRQKESSQDYDKLIKMIAHFQYTKTKGLALNFEILQTNSELKFLRNEIVLQPLLSISQWFPRRALQLIFKDFAHEEKLAKNYFMLSDIKWAHNPLVAKYPMDNLDESLKTLYWINNQKRSLEDLQLATPIGSGKEWDFIRNLFSSSPVMMLGDKLLIGGYNKKNNYYLYTLPLITMNNGTKIPYAVKMFDYAVLFFNGVFQQNFGIVYWLSQQVLTDFSVRDLWELGDSYVLREKLHRRFEIIDQKQNFALKVFLNFQNFSEDKQKEQALNAKDIMQTISNFFIIAQNNIRALQSLNALEPQKILFEEGIFVQPRQEEIIREINKSFDAQIARERGKKNSFQIRTGMGKSTVLLQSICDYMLFKKRSVNRVVILTFQTHNLAQLTKNLKKFFYGQMGTNVALISGGFEEIQQGMRYTSIRKKVLKRNQTFWTFKNQHFPQIIVGEFQEFIMNMELYSKDRYTRKMFWHSAIVIDEFDSVFSDKSQNKKIARRIRKGVLPDIDNKTINNSLKNIEKEFNKLLQKPEKLNIIQKIMDDFMKQDPKIQYGIFDYFDFRKHCESSELQNVSNFIQIKPRVDGIIQCQDEYQNYLTQYVYNLMYYHFYPYCNIQNFIGNIDEIDDNALDDFMERYNLEDMGKEQTLNLLKILVSYNAINTNMFIFMTQKTLRNITKKMLFKELNQPNITREKNCYDFLRVLYQLDIPKICFSGTEFSKQFQLFFKRDGIDPLNQNIFFIDHTYSENPEAFTKREETQLALELKQDYLFNVRTEFVDKEYFNVNGQCKRNYTTEFLQRIVTQRQQPQPFLKSKRVDFLIDPNGILFNIPIEEIKKFFKKHGGYTNVYTAQEFVDQERKLQDEENILIIFPIGYSIGFDVPFQGDAVDNVYMLVKIVDDDNQNKTTQKYFWQAISRARYSNFGIQTTVFVNQIARQYLQHDSKLFQNTSIDTSNAYVQQEPGMLNQDIKRKISTKIPYFRVNKNMKPEQLKKLFNNPDLTLKEVSVQPKSNEIFHLSDYEVLIEGKLREYQQEFMDNFQLRIFAAASLLRNQEYLIEEPNFIDEEYISLQQYRKTFSIPSSKVILENIVWLSNRKARTYQKNKIFKALLEKFLVNPRNILNLEQRQQQQQEQQQLNRETTEQKLIGHFQRKVETHQTNTGLINCPYTLDAKCKQELQNKIKSFLQEWQKSADINIDEKIQLVLNNIYDQKHQDLSRTQTREFDNYIKIWKKFQQQPESVEEKKEEEKKEEEWDLGEKEEKFDFDEITKNKYEDEELSEQSDILSPLPNLEDFYSAKLVGPVYQENLVWQFIKMQKLLILAGILTISLTLFFTLRKKKPSKTKHVY